jgi:hypothetical protein
MLARLVVSRTLHRLCFRGKSPQEHGSHLEHTITWPVKWISPVDVILFLALNAVLEGVFFELLIVKNMAVMPAGPVPYAVYIFSAGIAVPSTSIRTQRITSLTNYGLQHFFPWRSWTNSVLLAVCRYLNSRSTRWMTCKEKEIAWAIFPRYFG